jgi:hypothetical protein
MVTDRAASCSYSRSPTAAPRHPQYCWSEGATAAVGLVGNEGAIGIGLFMEGNGTPIQSVVEVAGRALRMEARALREEFRRGGAFQAALLRYTWALVTQISVTAVCNRLHPIEKRLCRWLLLTRDRVPSDQLWLTQEFIARQLGVRREGVTVAAQHLQAAGLIVHSRGHITIRDRRRLEARTCECYWTIRQEYDRLLRRGDAE